MEIWLPNRVLGKRIRAAVAALALLAGGMTAAGQIRPTDSDVKAAYLFNFGKFVRVSANGAMQRPSFDICVVGQDAMEHTLGVVTANEEIDHRGVHVRRVKGMTEARSCDIVFISAAEGDRIESEVESLRGADVLTVSDAPRFLDAGGMIQFVMVANHVRFAVNLDAVKRTHLILSSELLRVAISVTGAPAEAQP